MMSRWLSPRWLTAGRPASRRLESQPLAAHRFATFAIALLLALVSLPASAQVRAWLDRDTIAMGETATLNIETDQATSTAPDYAPLLRNFRLSGNTSSRSFERANGVNHARTLFKIALQPRHDGVIGLPGLLVGSQRTQSLTLTVTPAASATARAGGVVFIDVDIDAKQPYVQQAVGYTVRLYSATPLIAGQLDQAEPDGASLQPIGDDIQYNREISGRRYNVIERHYLLIPERSGTLTLPGAEFNGRGSGGFFDNMFGDGQRDLHAGGPPMTLQVRAIPDQAPQPWLPLHSLRLRYVATPQEARVGDAFTLTVEVTADGATSAQLPELQLPSIDGAQVFADPPQADETFKDGRPHVRLTRKFSVVPGQVGKLYLRGPKMGWWDVGSGARRTTSLPGIDVQVTAGTGGNTGVSGNGRSANGTGTALSSASGPAGATAIDDGTTGGSRGWMHVPGVQGEVRPWAFAAVVFALLWLITLMWGLHRHPQAQSASTTGRLPASPSPDGKSSPRAAMADLRRALDTGTLEDVATTVCAMASPPAVDVDALQQRLDDPRQREAIALLQRARWADGDGVAARNALRSAFSQPPHWKAASKPVEEPLPPLYPPA